MSARDDRQQLFWDLFDFTAGRGLEVGPLNRPVVTREQADVHYVDVYDRAGVVAHYADDPAVDTDAIPEIDYALVADGVTRTLGEAAAAGAPFDWVVASHVIEHVPDVIGWLEDLAQLVVDGGALVLAVPDKRFCFDALRPETTIGQMLEAHLDERRTPSARAVFDHFSTAVAADARDIWRGEAPGHDGRIHDLRTATEMLDRARSGDYVDCHVWLFSPESFVAQLRALRELGRSSWYVETLEPTRRNQLEFFAVLRRIPRGADATSDQPGEVAPTETRPEWLDTEALQHRVRELTATVDRLEERLARRGAKIAQLRQRLDGTRGEPAPADPRVVRLARKASAGAAVVRRRLGR